MPRHITEYFYDSIDLIIARVIVGDKKCHKKDHCAALDNGKIYVIADGSNGSYSLILSKFLKAKCGAQIPEIHDIYINCVCITTINITDTQFTMGNILHLVINLHLNNCFDYGYSQTNCIIRLWYILLVFVFIQILFRFKSS